MKTQKPKTNLMLKWAREERRKAAEDIFEELLTIIKNAKRRWLNGK